MLDKSIKFITLIILTPKLEYPTVTGDSPSHHQNALFSFCFTISYWKNNFNDLIVAYVSVLRVSQCGLCEIVILYILNS
jgi:hypothetical protein